LTALSSDLQAMVDAPPRGRGAKDGMASVLSSAKRMRGLIDDLLAFAQVGQGDRQQSHVDCDALVRGILNGMKDKVEALGLQWAVGPLPTVQGDPAQLAQVFENLISNALKFHRGSPPVLELSAERQGDGWVFAVRDNGIGIEPENFARVFKVFQRVNSRQAYPGTGLGLAICKKILEKRGGRIWLDSMLGSGSTFYFSLPFTA
jgi:signal transduction histidine kinase